MKCKEKIKKLENIVNQVYQGNINVYVLTKNNGTNKYEYENNGKTEFYESKNDFKKKKNIPENALIIMLKFV